MVSVARIKPFILPAAIVLGLLLHDLCALCGGIVPYLVFTLLLLTFSSTELRRLRFERIDLWLMLAQTVVAVALFLGFRITTGNVTLAQGMMLGGLCPVAGSVTVVAVTLGAKREYTVAYTIVGNLLVCVLAPVMFTFVGNTDGMSAPDAFFAIFGRIASVIGLPFFVMLCLQLWAKPVADKLKKHSGLAFYIWALALLLTLGQTIDFIFLHGRGKWPTVIALGIGAAAVCVVQLAAGRAIGRRCGDAVAGQQLLFQKNSAMGIWMANTYLNPLASSFLAFYSIWQNLINSYQIWRRGRRSQAFSESSSQRISLSSSKSLTSARRLDRES